MFRLTKRRKQPSKRSRFLEAIEQKEREPTSIREGDSELLTELRPYVGSRYEGKDFDRRFRQKLVDLIDRQLPDSPLFDVLHTVRDNFKFKRRLEALAPVAINFCEQLVEERKKRGFGKLVFLGRDARTLYALARRLASYHEVPREDVVLLDFSTDLARKAELKDLALYLDKRGILEGVEHMTLVDTGYSGSLIKPLGEFIEKVSSALFHKKPILSLKLLAANLGVSGVEAFGPTFEFIPEEVSSDSLFDVYGASGLLSKPSQLAHLLEWEWSHNIKSVKRLRKRIEWDELGSIKKIRRLLKGKHKYYPKYEPVNNPHDKLKAWVKSQVLLNAVRKHLTNAG